MALSAASNTLYMSIKNVMMVHRHTHLNELNEELLYKLCHENPSSEDSKILYPVPAKDQLQLL